MTTKRKKVYRSYRINENEESTSMNNPVANAITDPQLLKQYATIVNQKLNLTKQYNNNIEQLNRQLNEIVMRQSEIGISKQNEQPQQTEQHQQTEQKDVQTTNVTDNI